MPLTKAQCTNCGANLEVDSAKEAAVCPYCGAAYVVEKAINNYQVQTLKAENVTIINNGKPPIETRIERAFLLIEQGDFSSASEYLEDVLDDDPRNAKAYLGCLMCELSVKKEDALAWVRYPFVDNPNYKNAIRFGEKDFSERLSRLSTICCYNYFAKSGEEWEANLEYEKAIKDYQSAIESIGLLKGKYSKSESLINSCEERIAEVNRKIGKRKRARIIAAITVPCVVLLIAFVVYFMIAILPEIQASQAEQERQKIALEQQEIYNAKVEQMKSLTNEGEYEAAGKIAKDIGQYQIWKSELETRAQSIAESGDYPAAIELCDVIGSQKLKDYKATYADILFANEQYMEAVKLYNDLDMREAANSCLTKISSIEVQTLSQTISSNSIGTIVEMGHLKRLGDPIKWLVAEVSDESATLICVPVLADRRYYTGDKKKITYKDSIVKEWIDNEMLNSISLSEASDSILNKALISLEQYEKYLSGTPYNIGSSIYTEFAVTWWLSDTDYSKDSGNTIICITPDGEAKTVSAKNMNGIRPIITLRLSNGNKQRKEY